MAESSAPKLKVEALSQSSHPLAGETLLIAPDHYDAHSQKILEEIAVVSAIPCVASGLSADVL